MSARGDEPATRPRVPLPRRAGQEHLAPQLRADDPAPAGTDFSAFEGPSGGHRDGPAPAAPAPRAATRAAEAVAARRRARADGAG